ncbi:hypothetical protein BC826DRAFT_985900 [Russula brevipes]|nr:hypothetical protein BC826DRAFT_985900 [Russula brevipes]
MSFFGAKSWRLADHICKADEPPLLIFGCRAIPPPLSCDVSHLLFSWRSLNIITFMQNFAAYSHFYSFASIQSVVVHWSRIMGPGRFVMYDDGLYTPVTQLPAGISPSKVPNTKYCNEHRDSLWCPRCNPMSFQNTSLTFGPCRDTDISMLSGVRTSMCR